MTSSSKKIRRKKLLEKRKLAKKKMSALQETLGKMPKKCWKCSAKFDKSVHLDTWKIEVFSDRILLICDSCFKKMENKK